MNLTALAVLGLASLSLIACSGHMDDAGKTSAADSSGKNAPAAAGSGSVTGSTTSAPFLGDGDPTKNARLILASEEDVLALDPATGAQTKIYSFPSLTNIEGISVSADGSKAFVSTDNNAVTALDLGTGTKLWEQPIGDYDDDGISGATIALDGNVLYAIGEMGNFVALDPATGATQWSLSLARSGLSGFGDYDSISLTADRLYVGSDDSFGDNVFHAIDRKSQSKLYTVAIEHELSGGIVEAGDLLLVPMGDLTARNAATGDVVWTIEMDGDTRGAGTPVVAGDSLLFQGTPDDGKLDGFLYCVDLKTGTTKWTIPAGNDYAGNFTPRVIGNYVLGMLQKSGYSFAGNNATMFLAEIATGKTVWTSDSMSTTITPTYSNGQFFFYGIDPKQKNVDDWSGLIALDAKTGAVEWLDANLSGSAPIVITK